MVGVEVDISHWDSRSQEIANKHAIYLKEDMKVGWKLMIVIKE